MSLVSATEQEFADFQLKYGYSVDAGEAHLLPLSFAFAQTLPFCEGVEVDQDRFVEGQCFIAYAMSQAGGGFNPAAVAEAKTLVKKGLGRSAITKEWAVNQDLIGTDPMSQLKSVPMAYGLLKTYLCAECAGPFVV